MFKINFMISYFLALHCTSPTSLSQSVVPLFTEYLRIILDFSIQSINKFCRCFLENLSRIYFLPPPFLQATTIPHLDCHSSLLLTTLCPQSPVPNQCFPVMPRIRPKSITRPCVIRPPATSQISSPNTLPLAHCTPATAAFLIFLSCQNVPACRAFGIGISSASNPFPSMPPYFIQVSAEMSLPWRTLP